MMSNEEKVAFEQAMNHLSAMIASQTTAFGYNTTDLMHNSANYVRLAPSRFVDIDQTKKLVDIYFTLSKAGLYREIDPSMLPSDVLKQIR